VIYAGDELKGYGVIVFIRHDHGWVTTYAQNSKASVHRGEQVRSGQSIAWAGAIAHPFRFEMSKDGKPVDPRGYLPPAAFRKWRL
jgi:lipoprotein NlpD